MFKKILWCSSFVWIAAHSAYCQQVFGTMNGNVSDKTGSAVPNALITVAEKGKNVSFETRTNSAGFYSQGQLIPGTYTVTIQGNGFAALQSEPLTVRVDQVTRFDAVLNVAGSSSAIEVSAAIAPQLETDRADVATPLTSQQILALPDYQRSVLALEFLTPGVFSNPSSTPAAENPQGSFRARVNGQMWGATGYLLDGTDNQEPWLGAAVINPTPDSVSETRFSTQNFDAENGYVAGGLLVASTKSGTNALHGSLFDYLINNTPGFTTFAANPFTRPTGAAPLKSNQFGGSVGGRILPNRLFYFGDVQVQRRREQDTLLTTVPTALAHSTCWSDSGQPCNLSEYLTGGTNQIYDPTSGVAGTGQNRTPFLNNQVPFSRLSSQAVKLLSYFPLPNLPNASPNTVNNYVASGAQKFDSEQYNTREDYYLNQKNLLFGRYTYANFALSVPGAFGYQAGGPGLDSTGYSGISNVHDHSLALGYTHIFSGTMVNEIRFGFFRYNVYEVPGGYGTTPAADAGIPGLNQDKTITSGMPAFYIPGVSGTQMTLGYSLNANRCNCTLTEIENQFQIIDNFSKTLGSHTLKFGMDLKHTSNLRVPSDGHRSGELTFAGGYTGLGNSNGGTTGGLGLATFLLGQTTTFSRYVSSVTDATVYLDRAHFYAQDTWHPTRKLTVTYGLRWELTFPESTDAGKGGLLDLNTGNVVIFGQGGNSSRGYQKMAWTNFVPRLGVAYQLTPKTVIRAGYGWTYDTGFGGIIFNEANITLPVLLAQSNTPSNASQGVFSLASGPPAAVFPAANNGLIALPNNIAGAARPAKLTLPVVYAYNAVIERQLFRSLAVSAGFVGNSGRHVPQDTGTNINVNQAAFVPGVTNQNLLKPYYAKYGWTQSISYFCDCAVNQYNTLQIAADVRNFHGYTAHGTYVLQRAYGDGNNSYTMLYNRQLAYGDETNLPHAQVIVTQQYELPFGRGRTLGKNWNRLTDAVLGGWRVSGVSTFLTGLPFTATIGSYPAGYAFPTAGPAYPDRGTASPYDGAAHNRSQWYVGGLGKAFVLPAPNTFGNFGYDNLYGPSLFNQDIALDKSFRLCENYRFTLRAEAFNSFNRTNLGLPDANITNATAGRITSLASGATMRRLQFAFRVDF